jgi:hypothetical protein
MVAWFGMTAFPVGGVVTAYGRFLSPSNESG